MIFKSYHPAIPIPTDLTVWEFLFDSEHSPLSKYPASQLGGYSDIDTKERIRYDAVKEYTTYISTALVKNFGLKTGETVSFFGPNSIWYPAAMFSVLRAGGVMSGASPAYNVEEMTYALKLAEGKMIFTVPSSLNVAVPAAKNAGIPLERIFLIEGEAKGFTSLHELVDIGKSYGANGQAPQFTIPPGKTNKDVCGYLSFSSGTTGLPKAVMISHANAVAQCLQTAAHITEDNRKFLAILPLFHIAGLISHVHHPVSMNANVYMVKTFTLDAMLKAVVQYKLSNILLVPTLIIRLLQDPLVAKYDLSHVRRFITGTAPISQDVIDKLKERFPWTGMKQGYGMTESTGTLSVHPAEVDAFEYAHTVGKLSPNTEAKIIDPDTGKELGPNEPGELLARGPQVVMGYFNNEKATRETFDEDGWLHTGDIGYVDNEGYFVITDLLKELIKVKGLPVSPAELEDALRGHPAVDDAAVKGIPDDYSGERPKAYVALRHHVRRGLNDHETLYLGQQLLDYIQDNKVRYKWIVEIEFIDTIPRNPTGKILRRMLPGPGDNRGKKSLIVRDQARALKL